MTNFNLNRPGSTNKFSKYNNTSNFRLISQNEIYEFIKENPEMSEPEIIYYVYGYKRYNTYYEKRYAEGFRRALKKYDIQRKPGVNKLTGKKAYVYFTKEFMEATLDNFRNKHCKNNQDESLFNDLTNKYPKLLIIDDVVRLSKYINEVMDYGDFSMIPGKFSDDKTKWVKIFSKKINNTKIIT